jgi:LacI family transcriptional regulator
MMAVDDADVAQAVRLIREHACRGLRVKDVVEAVGVSRRVLQQRFQRILRRTPKEELMRVQIDRAGMLLVQTEMSVEQIAKCTGFAAPAYFIRAFRRETGVTPRVYRKNSRVPGLHAIPQREHNPSQANHKRFLQEK